MPKQFHESSTETIDHSAPEASAPESWKQQEDLLARMRPRMLRILRHHRVPEEDAEDVLQDVCVLLVYRWHEVRSPENWLIGATKNRCIMYWRQRRKSMARFTDVSVLDHAAEPPPQKTAELYLDINHALAKLPERYRTLLELRYGLGYEPREVAEALGYSRLSVSKVANRCLNALADAILVEGRRSKAQMPG